MKHLITTVGTSIFQNIVQKYHCLESDIKELEDKPFGKWNTYEPQINQLEKDIKEKLNENLNTSAEISSILKIADEIEDDIHIHFICTDTILSSLAAELVKYWFQEKNNRSFNYELKFEEISLSEIVVEDLNLFDKKKFEQNGLYNLVQKILKISPEPNPFETIFNFTGGYKALIPYVTLLSQFYQVPSYYLYNDDNASGYELINIPFAPIDIHWSLIENNRELLEELNEKGIENWKSYRLRNSVPSELETCIYYDKELDMADLGPIGKVFYDKFKKWILVYVLRGGPFSSKDANTHRKHLNDAISWLFGALVSFLENNRQNTEKENIWKLLEEQGGDNLNHTNKRHTQFFIAKVPVASPETRLLYDFKVANGNLKTLRVFDFRIGGFSHSSYPKQFNQFYNNNKDGDFIPFIQLKTQ